MKSPNGNAKLLQKRSAAIRKEIRLWKELAAQTKDDKKLLVMEILLRTSRKAAEQAIETKEATDSNKHPASLFSPIAEAQEISLPSFPMPGKGVPVKSKKGGVRLPDPGHIPQE